jgi:hypothetical protein
MMSERLTALVQEWSDNAVRDTPYHNITDLQRWKAFDELTADQRWVMTQFPLHAATRETAVFALKYATFVREVFGEERIITFSHLLVAEYLVDRRVLRSPANVQALVAAARYHLERDLQNAGQRKHYDFNDFGGPER